MIDRLLHRLGYVRRWQWPRPSRLRMTYVDVHADAGELARWRDQLVSIAAGPVTLDIGCSSYMALRDLAASTNPGRDPDDAVRFAALHLGFDELTVDGHPPDHHAVQRVIGRWYAARRENRRCYGGELSTA